MKIETDLATRTRTIAHNLALEAELARAGHALGEAGIDYVVLKGVPLLRRLEIGLDSRRLHDNDLLVRNRRLDSAIEALEANGYRLAQLRPGPRQRRTAHELGLAGISPAGLLATVDLHWWLFPPLLYPAPEEMVWDHVVPWSGSDDGHGFVLDCPLTIVHLGAHYAQHRFTEDRIVVQLAAAWNRWGPDLDREELAFVAREFGLDHAIDYTFAVAERLGLLTAPRPLIGSARASRLGRVFPLGRPDAQPALDYAGAVVAASLAGPTRAMSQFIAWSFPPTDVMAAVAMRTSSRWLWTRYPLRPFRPLFRVARRASAHRTDHATRT